MEKVTRGSGVLEHFLARQREQAAKRHLAAGSRTGRLLDIGCGSYPLFLSRVDFAERYGLDRCVDERVAARLEPEGVKLLHWDLEERTELPFGDDYFDAVTMLAVCEHIQPERFEAVLREVYRVLRAGGRYVLTTPAPWTDPLLRIMARLRLVSEAEIEEHKAYYTGRRIGRLLRRAGFPSEGIDSGRFELGMNLWVAARK